MVEKYYTTKVIGPRTLLLAPKAPNNTVKIDRFRIESINFTNNVSVKVGDNVQVDINNTYNSYYKCNYIYKENSSYYRINEFEENDSSVYILPLLEIQNNELLLDKVFINAYIAHYDFQNNLGEYVYLMYRYLNIGYYARFTKALQELDNCTFYQKDKDKRFDCFIFKIKESYIEDIKLIMKGKFSSISDKAKTLILRFNNQTNPDTPLYQILYKGELRRNELETMLGVTMPNGIDYASIPNIEDETWSYSKN